MRTELVSTTVQDLADDYERTGERITSSSLAKIFVKRDLTGDECGSVLAELERNKVPFEWNDLSEESELDIETSEPSLNSVLSFINNYKLLTKEQEKELGRLIRLSRKIEEEGEHELSQHESSILEKGHKAREIMILSNLRLVRKVVSYFSVCGDLTVEDLFQEGTIGLNKAISKFDPELDFKFSTYAVWWIRQAIERAIADKGLTIRVPVHRQIQISQFKKASASISAIKNGEPTKPYEIAEELNWSLAEVHFCWAISAMQPNSIDDLKQDKDFALKDFLVADIPSPEEEISQNQLIEGMKSHLTRLKERELDIISLRFGLQNDQEEKTLEFIGRKYDLTRERIRQIESNALNKLRLPSSATVLQENFLDEG